MESAKECVRIYVYKIRTTSTKCTAPRNSKIPCHSGSLMPDPSILALGPYSIAWGPLESSSLASDKAKPRDWVLSKGWYRSYASPTFWLILISG